MGSVFIEVLQSRAPLNSWSIVREAAAADADVADVIV